MNNEPFDQWLSERRTVWIFGAGSYGVAIYDYIKKRDIQIAGFIVSIVDNNYTESGEQIVDINDFREKYYEPTIGIVLALHCKFYNEIMTHLSSLLESVYFLDESFKMLCLDTYNTNLVNNIQYDDEFYNNNLLSQSESAKGLLDVIMSLIHPKTVIDVGCGVGFIANMFQNYGVDEVYGIDGDYVDRTKLQIAEDNFIPHDLTMPYDTIRRYDLAICLEVAEHLEEIHAVDFIKLLCKLSDTVVFSAGVPGQGGVSHFNEQPQSYWARLFTDNGYSVYDCIRPIIWNNEQIAFYYRQNILLYTCNTYLKDLLSSFIQNPILDIIHPELFQLRIH